MQDEMPNNRPIGMKLSAMYFVEQDSESNIAHIGKITGITKARGRDSYFAASLFHVDPISAGQPDAGTMTMSMEEVFNQWELYPTYAAAHDAAEWANKQMAMFYATVEAKQLAQPEAANADRG